MYEVSSKNVIDFVSALHHASGLFVSIRPYIQSQIYLPIGNIPTLHIYSTV